MCESTYYNNNKKHTKTKQNTKNAIQIFLKVLSKCLHVPYVPSMQHTEGTEADKQTIMVNYTEASDEYY